MGTKAVAMRLMPSLAVFCTVVIAGAAAEELPAWTSAWPNTDFGSHSVDLSEIRSGGVPKDGIPAISSPTMVNVASDTLLHDVEPVMTLEIEGEQPRAYPIRYLLWHEIINDEIGDLQVAITYCPLCNSAVFFDRSVAGGPKEFGVSGMLRHSDMIMYDAETESLWQQAVGEAIVGELAGQRLRTLPGWMESWGHYKTRNPDGLVMSQPGHSRPYGSNPYVGYDISLRPFLYWGEVPPHGVGLLERVVRVGDKAWLLERLTNEREFEDGGIVFSWDGNHASPLETRLVQDGRNIGTIRVRDSVTGEDLAHDVMFAFAFHAFFPDGEWRLEQVNGQGATSN